MRSKILGVLFIGILAVSVLASGYYRSESFEYSVTSVATVPTLLSFTLPLSGDIYKYRRAINVLAVVNASYSAATGVGDIDSCAMYLCTDMLGGIDTIASVTQASMPCTLYYAALNLDTLFRRNLYIAVDIVDSALAAVVIPYRVSWEIDASY